MSIASSCGRALEGAVCLGQVQSSYVSRISTIRQRIIKFFYRNNTLECIYEKEKNDILRVGQELLQK